MKNGTARTIGLLAVLLVPAAALAAQPGSVPASGSSTLQHQLQHTRAELKVQRAQTDQLRTRVKDLEQGSAATRAQLEQRDREISELRRKLAGLPALPGSASPPPPGH
jgi:septal ring factor EnvC (AmiA/AmiB activator)